MTSTRHRSQHARDEETEAALRRVDEEFERVTSQSSVREPGQEASSSIPDAPIGVDDFYAVMPMHSYIFVPSREMWPAASVNARVAPIDENGKAVKAAAWLDAHRPVEQLTWAPGESMLIRDRLIAEGGWIDRIGLQCFNLYRGPCVGPGDPDRAAPWIDHVMKVYPGDADHIIQWLAHRVQRPGEKPNHAIVLGGNQGIGKDTILEPVKHAIGPWNFVEVSPPQLLGRFNGFVKSVILRVSEARDLGETDRFAFYDHMKLYTAAPPDVIRCDEKNLREHSVPNVCGVIITTNHKTNGIYLPADDRRHFVAWSDADKDDFEPDYWRRLYSWYARGGTEHVSAYLATRDLTAFDPKAPPRKTAAFWAIVDANRAPEDAELADALSALAFAKAKSEGRTSLEISAMQEAEKLPPPEALTIEMLAANAEGDFKSWLLDRRSRRLVPHRLESAGYVPVRSNDREDGLWRICGRRQAIYALKQLSLAAQYTAAKRLSARLSP